KWVGYGEPTWEPYENVQDCTALDAFERDYPEVNLADLIDASTDIDEPRSYSAAINHPLYGKQWRDAIQSELESLARNNTWSTLENLPSGKHAIDSKWI